MSYGLDLLNSINATEDRRPVSFQGTSLWQVGAGDMGGSAKAAPVVPRGACIPVTFSFRYDTAGNLLYGLLLPIHIPLFNSSRHLIGVAMTYFPILDLVTPVLEELATAQEGMEMFVMDGNGYLLAATVGTYFEMRPLPSDLSTVPISCNYLTVELGQMGCRASAVGYPKAPALGAAGLKTLLSPTSAATLVSVAGGSKFYVAATKLRNSFDGFNMHAAVTIPQDVITGDVAESTQTNIGIVVGCVAAAFVLAFVIVWHLMGPLRMLARRMQMAAALEDNDQPSELSGLLPDEPGAAAAQGLRAAVRAGAECPPPSHSDD
jgi:hypothetical protein